MNERDIELAKKAGMIPDKYGMFFAKDYHEDGVDAEKLIELIRADERERIKAANAPEIERINAHLKSLEDAVKAEREACAKVCEGYTDTSDADHESHGYACAAAIRARGKA